MGTEIHWLGVLFAALAGFLIGGLWYGPLFGKMWATARGLSPETLADRSNMPMIFGLTFVLNLVSAFILDHTLGTYAGLGMTLSLALMVAGGVALGFVIPAMGVNYLFSRMSLGLFLIDAGYWLVVYLAMGAILCFLS